MPGQLCDVGQETQPLGTWISLPIKREGHIASFKELLWEQNEAVWVEAGIVVSGRE